MPWTVQFGALAAKQIKSLPLAINKSLKALIKDMQIYGPVLAQWPNFSKLKGQIDCYHCHLKKGRPTFAAIWKIQDKVIKVVEIRYVGTHEGARYRRIC